MLSQTPCDRRHHPMTHCEPITPLSCRAAIQIPIGTLVVSLLAFGIVESEPATAEPKPPTSIRFAQLPSDAPQTRVIQRAVAGPPTFWAPSGYGERPRPVARATKKAIAGSRGSTAKASRGSLGPISEMPQTNLGNGGTAVNAAPLLGSATVPKSSTIISSAGFLGPISEMRRTPPPSSATRTNATSEVDGANTKSVDAPGDPTTRPSTDAVVSTVVKQSIGRANAAPEVSEVAAEGGDTHGDQAAKPSAHSFGPIAGVPENSTITVESSPNANRANTESAGTPGELPTIPAADLRNSIAAAPENGTATKNATPEEGGASTGNAGSPGYSSTNRSLDALGASSATRTDVGGAGTASGKTPLVSTTKPSGDAASSTEAVQKGQESSSTSTNATREGSDANEGGVVPSAQSTAKPLAGAKPLADAHGRSVPVDSADSNPLDRPRSGVPVIPPDSVSVSDPSSRTESAHGSPLDTGRMTVASGNPLTAEAGPFALAPPSPVSPPITRQDQAAGMPNLASTVARDEISRIPNPAASVSLDTASPPTPLILFCLPIFPLLLLGYFALRLH